MRKLLFSYALVVLNCWDLCRCNEHQSLLSFWFLIYCRCAMNHFHFSFIVLPALRYSYWPIADEFRSVRAGSDWQIRVWPWVVIGTIRHTFMYRVDLSFCLAFVLPRIWIQSLRSLSTPSCLTNILGYGQLNSFTTLGCVVVNPHDSFIALNTVHIRLNHRASR